jgi:hypothetical protein
MWDPFLGGLEVCYDVAQERFDIIEGDFNV